MGASQLGRLQRLVSRVGVVAALTAVIAAVYERALLMGCVVCAALLASWLLRSRRKFTSVLASLCVLGSLAALASVAVEKSQAVDASLENRESGVQRHKPLAGRHTDAAFANALAAGPRRRN